MVVKSYYDLRRVAKFPSYPEGGQSNPTFLIRGQFADGYANFMAAVGGGLSHCLVKDTGEKTLCILAIPQALHGLAPFPFTPNPKRHKVLV